MPSSSSTTTSTTISTLSHPLPFPPFSVDWVDPSRLVITGGGGASKTGVPNGVRLYQIRGHIAALIEIASYHTDDKLPYFAKAMPKLDVLAVAIGNKVELLRLSDLTLLTTAVEVPPPTGSGDPVMVIAFSPSGDYMAVGAHDGVVRLIRLDMQTHTHTQTHLVAGMRQTTEAPAERPFRELAFHPNGELLLGACEDGSWRVWWCRSQEPGAFSLDLASTTPATSNITLTDPQKIEAQKKKDQAQGILYTCRCGRFSPDGLYLFTIHYIRRGPKGIDKRPILTKWALDLPPDTHTHTQIHLRPLKAIKMGQDPIMCIDVRASVGVAGDCTGRTLLFQTKDLRYETREKMHNFGVTSISFSPPSSYSADAGVNVNSKQAKKEEKEVRIASSSGDKTLRLQYLHPRTHTHTHTNNKPFFLLRLFAFFFRAFIYILLLAGGFLLFTHIHNVPIDRAIDVTFFGHYEPTIWVPVKEKFQEGVGVCVGVYEQHLRGYVEEHVLPVLEPVGVWVEREVRPLGQRALRRVNELWEEGGLDE